MWVRDTTGANDRECDECGLPESAPVVIRSHDDSISSLALTRQRLVRVRETRSQLAYVHGGHLPIRRSKDMSRSITTGACRRDCVTEGAVVEYGERLNGASFDFVNSTKVSRHKSATWMSTERVCDILKDRGVDNGSLNPKGILS